MGSLIKKHNFFIFIAIFFLIRQLLVLMLPLYSISTASFDDRLLMDFAYSITNGGWLGPYSEMTLVKGMFFSFFLGINSLVGIPYSISVTLLYSFSCIIFVIGIKKIFKTKIPQYFIFIILLFNPVSFADCTFLRVYRNCLTASQVLIITGCMFAVYLNRNNKIKAMIFWSIGAGIGLASLWHTREDGIWIIPFVIMVIIITVFSIVNNKMIRKKQKIIKCLIVALPVVILMISTGMISTINYINYGVFTTNELSNSNFTKTIELLYSIQPSEDIDFVSVPRSTMTKVYTVSPSLNRIKNHIEPSLDQWSGSGVGVNDLEVEDGWFFWSLRSGVASAGYYENAKKAEDFYKNVSKEIESGFKSGKLTKRPTMPSALMSPWKSSYAIQLPRVFISGFLSVARYDNVQTSINESVDDQNNGIRLFEKMTNNLSLRPGEDPSRGDNIRVNILNKITTIYQKTGLVLFGLAIFCYLVIAFLSSTKKKREKYKLEDIWLVLTGLLGSVAVLILGVSYTDISAYSAITYFYLAGAYPLIISFEIISIYIIFETLLYKYVKHPTKAKKLL